MELNRLIHFKGVGEREYNSIYRRCLLIKVNARFADPETIRESSINASSIGLFPRLSDLKEVLTSGPGILAGLRIQHGFERGHTRQQCLRLINDYILRGQDHGITDKYLRQACDLPPRPRCDSPSLEHPRVGVASGMSALRAQLEDPADSGTPPQDQAPLEQTDWRLLTRELLNQQMQCLLPSTVRNAKIPLQGKRVGMWDDLLKSAAWMPGTSARSRGSGGALMPILLTRRRLEDVLPTPNAGEVHVHRESLDRDALLKYAVSAEHRVYNVRVTTEALSERGHAGNTKSELVDIYNDLDRACERLKSQEEEIRDLMSCLEITDHDTVEPSPPEAAAPASPPAKRRRRQKTSDTGVVFSQGADPACASHEVKYRYGGVPARRFAMGAGAQRLSRRVLIHVLGHTVDLDIVNAQFALCWHLVCALGIVEDRHFAEELQTLKEVAEDRAAVGRDKLAMSVTQAKSFILETVNGRALAPLYANHSYALRLRRLGIWLRWLACSLLREEYQSLATSMVATHDADTARVVGSIPGKRRWPEATVFAYLWQRLENHVLLSWEKAVLEFGPAHLSLHFDGLRIDRETFDRIRESHSDVLAYMQHRIQRDTGVHVKIVEKEHRSLLHLLAPHMEEAPIPDEAKVLLQDGNCILLGLYRLDERSRTSVIAMATGEGASSQGPPTRRSRVYSECLLPLGVATECSLGFRHVVDGLYLVHVENGGSPHCFAVEVTDGFTQVKCWDRERVSVLPVELFADYLYTCTDSNTVVTFALGFRGDKPLPAYDDKRRMNMAHKLKDLAAGAGEAAEEEDVMILPDLDVVDAEDCDRSSTRVREALLTSMQQEQALYLKSLLEHSSRHRGSFECRLCPFWAAKTHALLVKHVREHHNEKNLFIASGTKQLFVLYALYDDKCFRSEVLRAPISSSAASMREFIDPPVKSSVRNIDRSLVLLLTAMGPHYAREVTTVGDTIGIRRVGNLYYDYSFYTLFLREALLSHGRIRTAVTRMTASMQSSGCKLVSLLPQNVRSWLGILEDIMRSPFINDLQVKVMDCYRERHEFTRISMDGTLRILRQVKGQATFNASQQAREAAPVADHESLRRVLTLVGITGACLGLPLVKDESEAEIKVALLKCWTPEQRAQVVSVATDQPSKALYTGLRSILPNLKYLCLDPVHVAINFEYSSGRKRTDASRDLRRLMCKFNVYDNRYDAQSWGPLYTGEGIRTTATEERLRGTLLDADMGRSHAARVLGDVNPNEPWLSVTAFLRAMAAFGVVHEGHLQRRSHVQGQSLRKLLWLAVRPERTQWYFNNLRALHALPRSLSSLMGSGTSTNETLNRDRVGRGVEGGSETGCFLAFWRVKYKSVVMSPIGNPFLVCLFVFAFHILG